MRVSGIGAWQRASIPLPEGELGTARTIGLIRRLVEHGVKHPYIRRTATDILQSVPAYNDAAEVSAIFHWVLSNIRFTKDMVGVGHGIETLQPPDAILQTRAGDCDDINAILLPSLLGSVGYETQAVTVKSNPEDPENFSHIYLEVLVNGQWIALDAARPDAAFGRAPEVYWQIQRWPLTGSGGTAGRMKGLMGYHFPHSLVRRRLGLGFDWSELVKAIPSITSGTAQVISAARAPTIPGYLSAAGYPYTSIPGITASAQGNTQIWVILGIGAIALVLLTRGRG